MIRHAAEEGFLPAAGGIRLYFRKFGSGPPVVIPNGIYYAHDFEEVARSRTVIAYDLRNRGRSDPISDPSLLARGIHNDIDDLESVRRHFEIPKLDLIGHSYVAMTVALYAMCHAETTGRVVQIGAPAPDASLEYGPEESNPDGVVAAAFARIGELQKTAPADPVEQCRIFWSALKPIYVADPAHADKIQWDRCELPNERSFMRYWNDTIFPSICSLNLTAQDFAAAQAPVLVVHGRKDRSAPYGGGRDWAVRLPNARLLSVDNAAHAPWIEAPEIALPAISEFLNGNWPDAAQRLRSATA